MVRWKASCPPTCNAPSPEGCCSAASASPATTSPRCSGGSPPPRRCAASASSASCRPRGCSPPPGCSSPSPSRPRPGPSAACYWSGSPSPRVVPATLSLAGRSAPGRPGQAVATTTAAGYSAFIISPLAIGLLAQATSLRLALALLILTSLAIAGLATRWPAPPAPAPAAATTPNQQPTRAGCTQETWGAPNLPDCGPPVGSIRKGLGVNGRQEKELHA